MRLVVATERDRSFAEGLAVRNMEPYYREHGLQWDPDRFRDNWAGATNYILECDGSQAGFVSLVLEEQWAYIRDLQLAPGHQGQGLGTWTLRQVERLSRERGRFRLRLRTFRSNPAIALYERLGFGIMVSGEVVVGMEKVLAGPGDGDTPASCRREPSCEH
ncbi:GNAT family N-acetyltransferase [Marinobacter halodurans]|uniref:GNAT family N-acetyltransferase n=1 Tax=Marinobacter halodurans TaxID=2528979 RepID=UPI0013F14E29|nr:GNAT family N-acetyltransferase [Marinobacter halodurans]